MRRLAVLVAVCLGFGVVANYALAWWLMTSFDFNASQNGRLLLGVDWSCPVPAEWPRQPDSRYFNESVSNFYRLEFAGADSSLRNVTAQCYYSEVRMLGWPMRSLRGVSYGTVTSDGANTRLTDHFSFSSGIYTRDHGMTTSMVIPFGYGRMLTFNPRGDSYFPIAPLWPGFAINTLLYASIPALILLPWGPLKRHRRQRRGACLKCGYDLSATDADRCPECGGTS